MAENAPAAPAASTGAGTERAAAPGGDAAPDASAAAPAWKPPKLKVYGREQEVDADTYHRHAQTGAAFQEQTRRLAERQRALDAQEARYANAVPLERLKTDTAAVLKELGIDPLKWSADRLVENHEAETLPPAEKELQEKQRKFEADKAAFEAEKARVQQAQEEAAVNARRLDLGERFMGALTAAGVPEGPATWPFLQNMVAYQMDLDALVQEWHRTGGAGGVSPEEAAQRGTPEVLAELAMNEVRAKDAAVWGKLDGPALLFAIPREVGDRYMEARLLEHQQRQAAGAAPTPLVPRAAPVQRPAQQAPAGGNGAARAPNGTFTTREHREFIDRLGLGGRS